MKIFESLKTALTLQFKDMQIVLLSIVPIVISLILMAALGTFGFHQLYDISREWISSFFASDSLLFNAVLWVIRYVILFAFYFIGTFFFLMLVSLLSCFFSDVISRRVENVLLHDGEQKLSELVSTPLKKLHKIIFNEFKKICFISLVVVLSIFLSFSLVLAPVAIYLTWSLVAVQFLDYNWSRHDLSFQACLRDFMDHWFLYPLCGIAFTFVLAIPVVGVLVFPFGTVFFSTLFVNYHLDE